MPTFLRSVGVLLSAVILCGMQSGIASADFMVTDVQASLDRSELHGSARIRLNLSEQAELAVENGVPLVVLTEFVLVGDGFLWNDVLYESSIRQRLRYHSLADRYMVEDLEGGRIALYGSVNEALKSMGVFRSQVFALSAEVNLESPEYTLKVRSLLDINRLPAALRPLAFFSPSWRLSSGWTKWQVTNR